MVCGIITLFRIYRQYKSYQSLCLLFLDYLRFDVVLREPNTRHSYNALTQHESKEHPININ